MGGGGLHEGLGITEFQQLSTRDGAVDNSITCKICQKPEVHLLEFGFELQRDEFEDREHQQ
jgi:hypothetical protein